MISQLSRFMRVAHTSFAISSAAALALVAFAAFAAPRECAYAHYRVRMGLGEDAVTWLKKGLDEMNARSASGGETWGAPPHWYYEWSGWGTLSSKEGRAYALTVGYRSSSAAEIAFSCDGSPAITVKLPANATRGIVQSPCPLAVPAGASVIRWALVSGGPDFQLVGLQLK